MITPLRSFLPLAGKILTYLEAIRNPMKHIVNTFAIGKTAILILPSKDSPPWVSTNTSERNLPNIFGYNQENHSNFPKNHPLLKTLKITNKTEIMSSSKSQLQNQESQKYYLFTSIL